jgi:serine/threonine protein kinase
MPLNSVELEENKPESPNARQQKGHTIIDNRFALINKITRVEADDLQAQTGIEVTFKADQNKAKFLLGRGQFGKLRLARDNRNNQFVGVKKIKGESEIAASQSEAELQKELNGLEHIMPLMSSVKTQGSEGQPVLYQFMPLAGFGNGETLQQALAVCVKKDPILTMQALVHVAKSLLLGLSHMHQAHIYHMDLKPSNVVIDNVGKVYLIDFGVP